MRIVLVLSVLLVAAAVTLSATATPPERISSWTFDRCIAAHATCADRCRTQGEEAKGGAACLIGCATAEVECIAELTAHGVTPWIERKTEQFRDFLDDFLRDLPIRPDDRPAPPPADPDYDRTAI